MEKSIFDWLGIEPTNDVSKIKKAYSQMAKIYHPADHPNEFQQLRAAYREALRIATEEQSYSAIEYDNQPMDTLEHTTSNFCHNPTPHIENIETADKDPKAKAPEYKFNIKLNNAYNFNQRQMAMFSFFVNMLDVFKHHAQDYLSDEYFTIVFDYWAKEPYRNEITPDFTAAVLDKLDATNLFSPAYYQILDKVLFDGRTDSGYINGRIRLEAIRIESERIKWANPTKPTNKNIQNMFLQLLKNTPPVKSGLILDEGLFNNHSLKKLYFNNGVLFSMIRKVKFYLINDCTCFINKRTGDLTVYDIYEKKIFAMATTHKCYSYVLKQLSDYGCHIISEAGGEVKSFTEEFTLDSSPFHKLIFDRRLNRLPMRCYVELVTFLLIFFLPGFTIKLFQYITSGSIFEKPLSLLVFVYAIVDFPLFYVTGFYSIKYLIKSLGFAFTTIANTSLYHIVQKECNNKKAVHDLANRIFIFDSYIFIPEDQIFIAIKDIAHIEPIQKTADFGDGYLKIVTNNEMLKYCFVGYIDTATVLYDEIEKRRYTYKSVA